jgi:surface protein
MKTVNNYINEALIKKNTKIKTYNYFPKDKKELQSLLKELLDERGKDADLNDIDTSDITDMSELFDNLDPYNIDISEWNVSSVKNMEWMFCWCDNFNSDLSAWDVSEVEDMSRMFNKCEKFNSDLSSWNVSKVTNMQQMFRGCTSLTNTPNWYKG